MTDDAEALSDWFTEMEREQEHAEALALNDLSASARRAELDADTTREQHTATYGDWDDE